MKIFINVLLLVLAVATLAQVPSPNSISIGEFGNVRLSIGAPEEYVLRSLRELYDVSEGEKGDFLVFAKTNHDHFYAMVSFKEGRLSSVTKFWDVNGPDRGVAVVRAIYGAMSSFDDSTRACRFTSFDHQEPTMEKRGVEISCGARHVEIFTNRWAYNSGSGESVVVNEVLGEGE